MDVLSINDVSHGGAIRLRYDLRVPVGADLATLIREDLDALRVGSPYGIADVVFIFAHEEDPAWVPSPQPWARAAWIRPGMDARFKPDPFGPLDPDGLSVELRPV